ncbi:FHA domain-containing protein [Nonomuraea sp. NPDC050310]|uniref:FHA domain-containing protein n=1 Tax=Nonomuraea sp. NPDC050310 TaxID=3154935 RepID=UPI0033DCAB18
MAVCPLGHPSTDDTFCDECGTQIGGAAPAAEPTGLTGCPVCQAPLPGRYCEVCGHDSTAPVVEAPPLPASSWEAVVGADRAYFERVIGVGGPDSGKIVFPPYCPERSYPLSGEQVRIGRASRSRGVTPEIDLGQAPPDPGVSHLHAVLMAQPDGSWTLVDPGSANGTEVNGQPVEPNVPVPLGDGDRIHLGAWTVITLRGAP